MIALQTHTPGPPKAPRTLFDFFDLLRSRWKRGFAFFLVVMTLVVIGLAVCPRAYVSDSKLLVRVGRESIGLDPTATTGQTISVYESRENEINSIVDVLSSRVVLEDVVDAIGPDVVLGKSPLLEDGPAGPQSAAEAATQSNDEANGSAVQPVTASGGFLAAVGLKDPVGSRETAIQYVQSELKVEHSKKSNVVSVSMKAGSARLAQRIVQEVMKSFAEKHMSVNRINGSREFFTEQAGLLDGTLNKARDELTAFKNKHGLMSIDGQQRTIQDELAALETNIFSSEAELAASKATVSSLEAAIAGLPKKTVTQEVTNVANGSVDRMRSDLNTLRRRKKELKLKYTDEHRMVVAVDAQIRELEQLLTAQGPDDFQATSALNPASQKLTLDLHTERTKAAALGAKVASLKNEHGKMALRMRNLNEHENRLAKLNQKVELLEANFGEYEQGLEQARIEQALEAGNVSNINIFQPATFVAKPVAPRKRLIFALGLFVATVGGLGFAVGDVYAREILATQLVAKTQAPVAVQAAEKTQIREQPESEIGSRQTTAEAQHHAV